MRAPTSQRPIASGHNSGQPSETHTRRVRGTDLDNLLGAARPRLIRLARARGVARDSLDDVAQETLLVAWQRVDHLRSPERFDAWLDGICHHVSQHYIRHDHVTARRLARLSQ